VQTLAHPNAWHRETAARLLYERQDTSAIEPLRKLARESSSAVGRMHALYALEGLRGIDHATLIAQLSDTHEQVRRHAVRMADRVALTSELLTKLDSLVDDSSLEVRYQLAFTLGTLELESRVDRLASLLRQNPGDRWMQAAIECSIGDEAALLAEMIRNESVISGESADRFIKQLSDQAATRKRVQDSGQSTQVQMRVATTTSTRSAEQIAKRQQVITNYQSALSMTGNIERGREHFRKQCSTCHRVEDIGNEIGPSLSAIKSRGAETVLTAVLDPNREVNPQFLNYAVSTLDGRVVSGMIIDEGSTSMTLRNAKNEIETVLLIDVDEVKNTGLSMMPEGFEDAMDAQAMADLIEYLLHS
jgi:putative heme-binding domain-containing protein